MYKIPFLLFIAISFISANTIAQGEAMTKKMLKKLHASEIIWDTYNYDGVFKAKNKKTGKWGMFQYWEDLSEPKVLINYGYDSLGFYNHSSNYTLVKQNNKYGLLGQPWGDDPAVLIIDCKYDLLKYSGIRNVIIANIDNKWGYLNSVNSDTIIPFAFNSKSELPTPSSNFIKYPISKMPGKLAEIIGKPLSIRKISLSGLGLTFLPSEIGDCVNATRADLSDNHLKELPHAFFKLKKLKHLDLGGNPSIIDFGPEYSKLINLKSFVVNYSYGGYYSTSRLNFSDELSKLVKLEKLIIYGYFLTDEGDLPNFIYKLPNLKNLKLEGFMSSNYSKVDFNKMACKSTLEELEIKAVHDFALLNNSVKNFPKLRSLSIITFDNHSKPTFIYDIKDVYYIEITGYYGSATKQESYTGRAIISLSKNSDSEVINKKEKDEQMKKWELFIPKQN